MNLEVREIDTPEYWEAAFVNGIWVANGGIAQNTERMYQSILALTESEVKLKGATILDIGCALGDGTYMLKLAGALATGADYSKAAIDRARERCPGLRFEVWNVLEIPEDFDVIIANCVLRHLADRIHDGFRVLRTRAKRALCILGALDDLLPDDDPPQIVHDFGFDSLGRTHRARIWKR